MKNLTIPDFFFFTILIILTIAFYNLIAPFLTDLFLALILIIIFKRPVAFFQRRFKNNTTKTAFATIVLIILTLFIPLTFVGLMVSKEATNTFAIIKNNWDEIKNLLSPDVINGYLHKIPVIGEKIGTIDFSTFQNNFEGVLEKSANFILSAVQNIFMNITVLIVHFCIVMFLLFYMLADGKQILERIQKIIPLKDEEENQFFDRLQKVIDALVMNTFLIGIIEGTYGGILFTIVGIPSPFFWGLLMSIFSIIPFLGANTILFPAAIIEFLLGNFWKGLIIMIFGVGAVFIDQHIIKNRLDGSRSGMHPAIVFLACFGGIISLGLVGFLAGPVIAALFLVAWQQFAVKYQQEENPTPTNQNQT